MKLFLIKCLVCGVEQNWGEGVTVGRDTVIEVAERAVFCGCGVVVEEENGVLMETQVNIH